MTPQGNPTTPEPHAGAVRLVVILLFSSLALSVLFAAQTWLFRQNVLDYQLANTPGAADGRDLAEIRGELSRTLWTRPIPIFVVALGYVWVARALRRGARRAYLRVRVVSLVGVVAVGFLIVSGEYPVWLRAVQGVQLVALAALAVAVNRRVMRTAFTRSPAPPRRPGSRRAALVLVVLAPVVAELTLGTVPVAMAWVVLLYLPIYGAGVLLIRELVRRTGAGWGSVALMGLAYGLVEEGIALQSLTSPHFHGVAGWAPRLLGINTAYTELNLPYHAVFSVVIPIALVELLFPGHGRAPYLRRGGVVGTGVVALLGVGLLRVTVPLSEDPGYTLPVPALIAILALIAALSILALRVLPRWPTRRRPSAAAAPRPAVVGMSGGLAALGFLGLLFPFAGAQQPAFTQGDWVLAPMLAAAVLVVGAGLGLRRWSSAQGWTGRHRLAAITGALVAHTVRRRGGYPHPARRREPDRAGGRHGRPARHARPPCARPALR